MQSKLTVKAAAIAGLIALGASSGAASAADNEVAILGLWPFSGPYADVGPLLDNGAKVAIESTPAPN